MKLYCVAVLLTLAASSAAAAEVPQPVVIDASGKVLGPLLQQGQVLLTFPGKQLVQAAFVATGFAASKDVPQPTFYYKTDVCSGASFLPALQVPGNAFVVVDNGNFTYASPNAGMVAYKSTSLFFHCARTSGSAYLAPTRTVSMSSLGFTPPFSAAVR